MIAVSLDQLRQEMDGFGADLTEQFPMSESVLDLFFSRTNGIGLSLVRYPAGMDAWNARTPLTGSPHLDESEETPTASLIGAAARGAKLWVYGAPGSNMLGTQRVYWEEGGSTDFTIVSDKPAYLAWLLGACADAQSRLGVPVWGVSLANEPDPGYGPWWDPSAMRSYLVYNFGPAVRAQFPSAKIIYPDCVQFAKFADFVDPWIADPEFLAYADVLAGHSYGDPYPGQTVAGAYPAGLAAGKRVWVSEGAPVDVALTVNETYASGSPEDLDNGMRNAAKIAAGISAGASSWQWWWFRAHDESIQPHGAAFWRSHQGLRGPTVTAYPGPGDPGADRRRFWMLGNWARFVRPGWRRVESSATGDAELSCNAFADGSGGIAIVLVNTGTAPKSVDVAITGGSTPGTMTPFLTDLTHDLEPTNHVTLSGGSLSYTVPARSVVTLFCGLSARSARAGSSVLLSGTYVPGRPITVT
jgi:O-glycosyl hydrolase